MNEPYWYAHVTVAAIICRSEKFLMVKEFDAGRIVINQPAGHLEKGETLIQAVERESLEETGWKVKTRSFLGIRHNVSETGISYVRLSFVADAISKNEHAELDEGIIESVWMSRNELDDYQHMLRSPVVLHDVDAYLNDMQYPLDLLFEHPSVLV